MTVGSVQVKATLQMGNDLHPATDTLSTQAWKSLDYSWVDIHSLKKMLNVSKNSLFAMLDNYLFYKRTMGQMQLW